MAERYDIIIAGAGLAGACAAFFLSRQHRVLMLEAERPAAGASGAAAGMANPLMSRRARPVWRMPEAMTALQEVLEAAGAAHLMRREGILRPALSEEQAEDFRRVSNELPNDAEWLTREETEARYQHVHAPLGALWGKNAVAVDIPAMIDALLAGATANGAEVVTGAVLMGWGGGAARVQHALRNDGRQEEIPYNEALLLCLGREYNDFDALRRLRLHQIKGQLVRVARPPALADLPHVAGRGYVMVEPKSFLLGSTYEHSFCDLRPDANKTQEIIEDAAAVVPALADADVLEAWAAVRVTVPGIRLPMVGPVPGEERVWLFTGLGSRGLMMAPMIARALSKYMRDPAAIQRELRVRPAS